MRMKTTPMVCLSIPRVSWKQFWGMLFVVILTQPTSAHPHHSSIAQLQYSAECDCFEVSLKLETESLEAALARQSNGVRKPLESSESDTALQNYIASLFKLRSLEGQVQKMRWVGKDIKPAVTWVYFMLAADGDAFELSNRLLFSEEKSQINSVQVLGTQPAKMLRYNANNQGVWQRID
jgi:hypothetical protein